MKALRYMLFYSHVFFIENIVKRVHERLFWAFVSNGYRLVNDLYSGKGYRTSLPSHFQQLFHHLTNLKVAHKVDKEQPKITKLQM